MVYRFQRHDNEIKNGAKLTVREGQVAVFINEGQLADVFKPGMYTLETANLPILSTLMGWKHGFDSPFKAEVYFISTRRFTDLKWGTKNPIMYRDVEFGPVRLRAFGTYAIRVNDSATFIREIVGTDGQFTTDEITDQLRNLIVSRFTDKLGESKLPILDLCANYDELSEFVTERIAAEFNEYGIEITKLLVENISLPPNVEEALDQRSSMGIIGNMGQFTQYQMANSMPVAAANPGGLAAAGVGLGMGVGMAGQVAASMQPQQQMAPAAPPPIAPPPLPAQQQFFAAINGVQAGPFDTAALQQNIAGGALTHETLIWAEGMPAWTAASQVPEVAGLFGAVPPPLPPV